MLRKALPIRFILLGAFLLVGLLPTILVTGMAFFEARSALKTEIDHDTQTRATATVDEIDRIMFERLHNTASWSQLEIMQDIRIGDVDKRLSKFLSDSKYSYHDIYHELYVVDNKGIVIASSNAENIGKQQSTVSDWLSTKIQGNDVRIAPIENAQLLISAEIKDAFEGNKLGTLVTVFNWKQISNILESAVTGRSGAALLDSNNTVLSMTKRWSDIQSKEKISTTSKSKGYQGYNGFAWHVVIAQYRLDALAPIRQMAYIFIGLLIATIVLASLIAVPVATALTKPLVKLTAFANNFIREPSNALPPSNGSFIEPLEITALSSAFSKMISDLERSKENLTRAAKLAVVGEMAAAMSHEVRTPLGILRSSAQVLLREPEISEEGREVCGFIISETERLNKLVSALIDSARPRLPEFKQTNVAELAEQCVAMLRTQAENKHIALICETGENPVALCDTEQITQVLLNLLLNAIQVLPDGGNIILKVTSTIDQVLVVVADNGPGIPVELRSQIFEPFFTKRRGGIGLGLAIVKQIVIANHGNISVHQSSLGGAEFRLQLPTYATE
ncbi:HAMP domain-containing sensor histidine kinase [Methylotenera sp.]|uniref:sensor histidine kinase n=1 Tax=Methylotenera sp. TaxID=2051956 RepID=UPI00272FD716|nr:HAMP domain-containing sensor histidine kinase [Methylotenera sp.]MDP2071108.1 HAMP domain-containing sensor histidine kinase [Methylotenera sp.]MDP2231112.1 HAMP domain-containing sensor histidine kinase [Methylotenera sp.]MDP3006319.1 HAMP domain-containing sensor histidine kinase [Methylotenera sp.]MDP3140244.1 HAMP domain-containing sensor histidine kinase [Methylotenera sp.]